jgi:hypothetical protein
MSGATKNEAPGSPENGFVAYSFKGTNGDSPLDSAMDELDLMIRNIKKFTT